jgi:hypothetical protein
MSYADELGEMLLEIVDYGEAEGRPAVVEHAVATARDAILELPDGYRSNILRFVANLKCGIGIGQARIREQ